jgi:hypothetical protein
MGKEPKGEEPKGDGRVNKGHFFQPGHLLARLTGVGGGGAAAASGITPAQADWPDDPLASYSVGVWCVGIAR